MIENKFSSPYKPPELRMRTPNSFSSPEESEESDGNGIEDFGPWDEPFGIVVERAVFLIRVPADPAVLIGPGGVALDPILRFAFRAWAAYLRLAHWARPRPRVTNARLFPPRNGTRSPE